MAHFMYTKKNWKSLVTLSLILNLIVITMRLMWLWFPSQQLAGDSTSINQWVANVFLTVPNVLQLSAFSLIVVFWFEVIQSKRLRLRFYEISKIVIFIITPIMQFVCLIMQTVAQIGIQRFIILCYCYDANVLALIVIVGVGLYHLHVQRGDEFASDTWTRVLKMSYGVIVGMIIFSIYGISLIIYFSAFLDSEIPEEESIFIDYLHRTVEWTLALDLLYISDWKNNPYTLSCWLFLGRDLEDNSGSAGGSNLSGGSDNSTGGTGTGSGIGKQAEL